MQSSRYRPAIFSLLFAVFLIGSLSPAQAQRGPQRDITINEIEPYFTMAPNLPAPGSKARKVNTRGEEDWMVVYFTYEVTPIDGADYLDEGEFRVYVEVPTKRDPRSDKFDDRVVLTGTVTYVNLPTGENAGSLYIPPQTLQRYGGRREMERSKPKCNIHVEAFANRRQVDAKSMNEEKGEQRFWFQKLPNVDGQIYRQNQSPFIATDSIMFPPIKIDTR